MPIFSATSDNIARSCEINMRDMPFFFRFFSKLMIFAWTSTSTAVVGSSAITNFGFNNNAIAMTILCFIPPLSSCGYFSKTE